MDSDLTAERDVNEPELEPRWLTSEQQLIWRAYIRTTQAVWCALEDDLARERSTSLTEYEVLAHLSEAVERRLRMSELAELACSSRSRLTHTVRRLEERELVQRRQSCGDGRGVECLLTDAGFEHLLTLVPVHVNSVQRVLFDPLSGEQQRLLGQVLAAWAQVVQPDGARPVSAASS